MTGFGVAALLALLSIVAAKPEATPNEPLVHEYIKLALWLIGGIIVGVFFEAKMHPREIIKPIIEKGLSGITIALGIYGMFMFASIVTNYL